MSNPSASLPESEFSSSWGVILVSVSSDQIPSFSAKLNRLFSFSDEETDQVLRHLPVLFLDCPSQEAARQMQNQLMQTGVEIILSNDTIFRAKQSYVVWPETGMDPAEVPGKIQVALLEVSQAVSESDQHELDQRILATKALYQNLDAKLETLLSGKSEAQIVQEKELEEARTQLEETQKKVFRYEDEIVKLRAAWLAEKNKIQYFLMQFRRSVALQQSLQAQFHRQHQETKRQEEQNQILKECVREIGEAGQAQETLLKEKSAEWESQRLQLEKTSSETRAALEERLKKSEDQIQELEEAARSQENFLQRKMAEWEKTEKIFLQAQVELKKLAESEHAKYEESQTAYVGIWAKLNEAEQKAAHEKNQFENAAQDFKKKIAELETFKQNSEAEFAKQTEKLKEQIKTLEEAAKKQEAASQEKADEWKKIEKSFHQTQLELQNLLTAERSQKEESKKELSRLQSQLQTVEQAKSHEKNEFETTIRSLEQKIKTLEEARSTAEEEAAKRLKENQSLIEEFSESSKNQNAAFQEKVSTWDEMKKNLEQRLQELQGALANEQAGLAEALQKYSQVEADLKVQIEAELQKNGVQAKEIETLISVKSSLEDEKNLLSQKWAAVLKDLEQSRESVALQSAELAALKQESDRLRSLFQSKVEELADAHRFAKTTELELREWVERESAKVHTLEERLKAELKRAELQIQQQIEEQKKLEHAAVAEQSKKDHEWQQRYSALEAIKEGILSALKVEREQSTEMAESYQKLNEKLVAAEEEILIWKKETAGLEKKIGELESDTERDFQAEGSQDKSWQPPVAPQLGETAENVSIAAGKNAPNHLQLMLELEDQKMRAQEWERKARELEKEMILLRERFKK